MIKNLKNILNNVKFNKIKKILIIIIVTIFLLNFEMGINLEKTNDKNITQKIFTINISKEKLNYNTKQSIKVSKTYKEEVIKEEIDIDSRIALIYDRASGRIIYEKNGNKQTPMASTTKIMTAIIVIENTNLKDVVTIDKKSASVGGSTLGLKYNDKITVNDLLYGLMLRSGNDAASALARYVGGSIEKFADLMNNKAQELGLVNTHFVVPHGLDNKEHYTTAYELAKITDYALKNEIFKKIVSTSSTVISINGNTKEIANTNKLLNTVPGVYGVKTGFTNGAGRCLVTALKKQEIDVITVIIGANTNDIRTKDTKNLLEYVEKNYELINFNDIISNEFEKWKKVNQCRFYVDKGKNNSVELLLEDIKIDKMLLKKNEIDNIEIKADVIFNLKSPVIENQTLGILQIFLDEENIMTLQIYNQKRIDKKEVWDYFQEFMTSILNLKFV